MSAQGLSHMRGDLCEPPEPSAPPSGLPPSPAGSGPTRVSDCPFSWCWDLVLGIEGMREVLAELICLCQRGQLWLCFWLGVQRLP